MFTFNHVTSIDIQALDKRHTQATVTFKGCDTPQVVVLDNNDMARYPTRDTPSMRHAACCKLLKTRFMPNTGDVYFGIVEDTIVPLEVTRIDHDINTRVHTRLCLPDDQITQNLRNYHESFWACKYASKDPDNNDMLALAYYEDFYPTFDDAKLALMNTLQWRKYLREQQICTINGAMDALAFQSFDADSKTICFDLATQE